MDWKRCLGRMGKDVQEGREDVSRKDKDSLQTIGRDVHKKIFNIKM